MNFIISLIYAPLIFIALKYIEIKIVSLVIFIISLIWFLIVFRKDKKDSIFPLLYLIVSVLAFCLQDFVFFKSLPVIISFFITIIMLASYITKKSVILYFAEKFSKYSISLQEKEYIHKSTIFWIFISLLNGLIHLTIFFDSNIEFWVYYSSFGWYIIFMLAGIIQFLHRKFIFLKRVDV